MCIWPWASLLCLSGGRNRWCSSCLRVIMWALGMHPRSLGKILSKITSHLREASLDYQVKNSTCVCVSDCTRHECDFSSHPNGWGSRSHFWLTVEETGLGGTGTACELQSPKLVAARMGTDNMVGNLGQYPGFSSVRMQPHLVLQTSAWCIGHATLWARFWLLSTVRWDGRVGRRGDAQDQPWKMN